MAQQTPKVVPDSLQFLPVGAPHLRHAVVEHEAAHGSITLAQAVANAVIHLKLLNDVGVKIKVARDAVAETVNL